MGAISTIYTVPYSQVYRKLTVRNFDEIAATLQHLPFHFNLLVLVELYTHSDAANWAAISGTVPAELFAATP